MAAINAGPGDTAGVTCYEEDDVEAAPSAKAPTVPSGPGVFRIEVPLARRRAIVALPEDVSAADTTKICAILTAYATS